MEEELFDPMTAHFNSIFNMRFSDSYLPGALLIGGVAAEGDYHSISDVPCQFDNGKGSCFKGIRCVKKHTNSENDINTIDGDVPQQRIDADFPLYDYRALAKRQNLETVTDIRFKGKVTFVHSVDEFYVLPNKTIQCVCGCQNTGHDNTEASFQGQKGLEYVLTLKEYLRCRVRSYQYPSYDRGHLVAVKVTSKNLKLLDYCELDDSKYLWCRAIVLESQSYDVKKPFNIDNILVRVQLVDYGLKCWIPLNDMAALPSKFLSIPPLIFRCKLDSIRSVGPEFSVEANKVFARMIKNKSVVVTYKSGPYLESIQEYKDSSLVPELGETLLVNLTVMEGTSFTPVTEKLLEKGYGITIHPMPTRPHLFEALGLSVAGSNLITHSRKAKPNEMELIQERNRIFQKVTREDGYFEEKLSQTPPANVFVKFPALFAKPGMLIADEIHHSFNLTTFTQPLEEFLEMQYNRPDSTEKYPLN